MLNAMQPLRPKPNATIDHESPADSDRHGRNLRTVTRQSTSRRSRAAEFLRKVEAPPGFEPGVEVLQTGSAITKLLSRLAFWPALIRVLPRVRRVLFPSCSQVHFTRKLLIVDPAFDQCSIVLFRGCAQLLDREIERRFMGTD
jgi:hypothetical protein